jgi:general secretion pathway protein J
LIEVMLASAILVSITVLVWGSISVSFRSSAFMMRTFDESQSLRLAMDRMTREISMAFISAHANRKENLPDFREELAEEIASGAVQEDVERIITNRAEEEAPRKNYVETAFVGKSSELHFTSLAHVRTRVNERNSDQAEISYFVRTSRNRRVDGHFTKELVRREDTTLDDDVESGGIIYTLIDEVEDVEFEYWKLGKEEDEEGGGRWVRDWDSRKSEFRGELPRRVKITVILPPLGDSREERKFVTQAQVMMTEILN